MIMHINKLCCHTALAELKTHEISAKQGEHGPPTMAIELQVSPSSTTLRPGTGGWKSSLSVTLVPLGDTTAALGFSPLVRSASASPGRNPWEASRSNLSLGACG